MQGNNFDKKSLWNVNDLYDRRVRKQGKCYSKRSWTYPKAIAITERYRGRVALTFGEFNTYYCHDHESWHVGHRGNRKAIIKALNRFTAVG